MKMNFFKKTIASFVIVGSFVCGSFAFSEAKTNMCGYDTIEELAQEPFNGGYVYLAKKQGDGIAEILPYNYGPIMKKAGDKYLKGPHPMMYLAWKPEYIRHGFGAFLDTLKKKNGKVITPDGTVLNGKEWWLITTGCTPLNKLTPGAQIYMMGEIKRGSTKFWFLFDGMSENPEESVLSMKNPLY